VVPTAVDRGANGGAAGQDVEDAPAQDDHAPARLAGGNGQGLAVRDRDQVGQRDVWPGRSGYRSPPPGRRSPPNRSSRLPAPASANRVWSTFQTLAPIPQAGPGKVASEPSLASFAYRRVLQLLSQPAVEVRRVCPGRQGKGGPCARRAGPAASPRGLATTTSWPIREPADPVVEPSIVARGPPMPSGRIRRETERPSGTRQMTLGNTPRRRGGSTWRRWEAGFAGVGRA
jgi:hypothetical protein